MITKIFLLLGTNQGDRVNNLESALQQIEAAVGRVSAKSPVYVTQAWGKTDQPDFYNQVVEIESSLRPKELLSAVLNIEKSMGRHRTEKWGERIIDIDILFYGNRIVESDSLRIPHPEILNRRFTLVPMHEIAPDFIHPVYRKSIRELLEVCPDNLGVTLLQE